MTAAVSRSTKRSTAAGLSRGRKLTSKGVRGNPYHFSKAPQVTAPAAAVAPVPPLFERHRLTAPGDFEGEPERILVGLGAAVDPEHGVESQPANFARRAAARSRIAIGNALVWNAQYLPRLAFERGQPTRVPIAQSGDRVAAVEIQDLAAVTGVQPHPFAMRHFDGVLREHLREMAVMRRDTIGVLRPASSPAGRRRGESRAFIETQ